MNDPTTDPMVEIERLRDEIEALKRRLELRAVENRALVVALDTIGMCAHAQGRRFTIALLAVADADLNLACESVLVSDAAYDEAGLGREIVAALEPKIDELRRARAMHPAAENLLEVLVELDEVGVLEDTYNLDDESEHLDVREDSVPPLEAAIYAWRAVGRPISLDEGTDEVEPGPDVPANVVPFPPPERGS